MKITEIVEVSLKKANELLATKEWVLVDTFTKCSPTSTLEMVYVMGKSDKS